MQNIPEQVQARADNANNILKDISGKEKGAPGSDAVHPEDQGKGQPAEAETVESLKRKLAETEHKLSVLQGKYNSEIKAVQGDVTLLNNLKNQNRTLTGQLAETGGRLAEANRLIGDLQKQITEKPKTDELDDTDPLSLLSQEDRGHLSEEGFERKTVEIVGKLVKALTQKVAPSAPADQTGQAAKVDEIIRDREQEKQDRLAERVNTFWDKLTEKVPDWETINGNANRGVPLMPEFDAWLDTALPYSDKTRRDILGEAQQRLDYTTVIQIFQDFKATLPPPGKKEEKVPLDLTEHIEPESTVGRQEPPDGAAPKGKTYTRAEVKAFYDDKAKGKWKGTEEEWVKRDADILKAHTEGRIRD